MDTCWHQHHLAAAKIPCPRKWFFDISLFVSLCIGEYKEAAQIVAQIRQVVGAIAFEGPQTDEIVSLIKQQVRPSAKPSLLGHSYHEFDNVSGPKETESPSLQVIRTAQTWHQFWKCQQTQHYASFARLILKMPSQLILKLNRNASYLVKLCFA